MLKIKSHIDTNTLLAEIKQLTFNLDGSGAYMALAQSTKISELEQILYKYKSLLSAIDEISKIRNQQAYYLTINNLPPNVIVPIHTDTLKPTTHQKYKPRIDRWHLPIATNISCWFWGETECRTHLETGFWHGPIRYWEKHSVGNEGITERIHIVVDLDTP